MEAEMLSYRGVSQPLIETVTSVFFTTQNVTLTEGWA